MSTEVLFPLIEVQLPIDNPYAIVGAVSTALSEGGVSSTEIAAFFTEATHDGAKAAAHRWVKVT